MQVPTRHGFVGRPKLVERYERTSSIRPAGVLATACTQWGPCATREVPAVIAVWINWQLARDRPGRLGWRRGSQYRRSRVTPVEGRGLVVAKLNRTMIGWANYFCLGPVSNAYSAVENHACKRLR